jgi:hypothetical protein
MWNYWNAIHVFIQRDDGLTNMSWSMKSEEKRDVYVSVEGVDDE